MRNSLKSDLFSITCDDLRRCQSFLKLPTGIARKAMLWMLCFGAIANLTVLAQDAKFVLARDGRTIVLEPYAPNIIRITLSKDNASAAAAAGYGLVGTPSMTGWTHEQDADGDDVFRSGRLVVHVSADHLPESRCPHAMPLDELNQSLRDHYFGGGAGNRRNEDTVSVTTAVGQATPDDAELVDGSQPRRCGSTQCGVKAERPRLPRLRNL